MDVRWVCAGCALYFGRELDDLLGLAQLVIAEGEVGIGGQEELVDERPLRGVEGGRRGAAA